MDLSAGVSGHTVQTSRLRIRCIESGPSDGVPIVLIHGNGKRGGRVRMEMFEGSGHGPVVDAADRWAKLFFEFVASAEFPVRV
jgi:hypothetical protein